MDNIGMSDMMLFGNSLGKKYKANLDSNVKTDAEKTQEEKDREALRKHHQARRAQREQRLQQRDASKKTVAEEGREELQSLEEDKESKIESEVKKIREQANHLARKYGLKEPNNPEALKHDRYHCYKCDMRLHIPDAYKELPQEVQTLFNNDQEVRHLCCFCFGNMEHAEIMKLQDEESDRKIRMMVYNPDKGARLKVEDMTKERRAYIEEKIKKYESVVSLIGNIKHDVLEDEEETELAYLKQFPTRYDYACN